MIYIYHNKTNDEYYAFNNLARLSDGTGISYDTLKSWFTRENLDRVERDGWLVVRTELVKRLNSKK